MSNIIPPLLSDTPPPPPDNDEHEDDEFGDFTGTNLSYDCDDSFSPPGSPLQLPTEPFELDDAVPTEIFDINSNSKENMVADEAQLDKSKDFRDKRKDFHSKSVEASVDSSIFQDSILSTITKDNVHDKLHISGKNIATVFIENDIQLSDENHELNEIKNNEETTENIETNCDTNPTFSQKEISNFSSTDVNKSFEEASAKNIEHAKIEFKECNISKISNDMDNFSDFCSVLVNNDATKSNKGANSPTNAPEDMLNDNNVDTELTKQCEKLGNNSSIEITSKNISQVDTEGIESFREIDNDTSKSQILNTHSLGYDDIPIKIPENSVNVDEFMVPNIAEIPDMHGTHTTSSGTESEQLGNSENLAQEAPSLDIQESNSSSEIRNSVESVHNNTSCLDDNDFGAFIGDSSDVQKLNLKTDEYNDFATLSSDVKLSDQSDLAASKKLTESKLNAGDFGDFRLISSNSRENVIGSDFNGFQTYTENTEGKTPNMGFEDDDDDGFGDFATIQVKTLPGSSIGNSLNQEFQDFATFPPPPQDIQKDFDDDEDDFGDFATTSVTLTQKPPEGDQYSKILLLTETQALEKSTEILREMFPPVKQTLCDFESKGLEANDKIFNQIKNITDTHALSYQWPKSASQNLLLKSLNIDSRNILYGPGWNPSMPRFAANLSLTPLEPVKSEVLTPTPARETNPSNSSQSAKTETLQFNLSEMALPEPLEYLEQLVAQLEIPNFKSTSSSHTSSFPANEFENWEAWLQSISTKEPNNSSDISSEPTKINSKNLVPSAKLEPTVLHGTHSYMQASKADLEQKVIPTIKHDDFEDFVSYSSPAVHENTHAGHSIVLRETHISNKELGKPDENDIVSWLEPTIVTPELTRKERRFVEADDEFDDFQMVIVPEYQGSKPVENSPNLTVKPLEVLQPQAVKSENGNLQAPMNLGFVEEKLREDKTENIQLKANINIEPEVKKVTANDDDFGDFTFSLPNDSKASQNISAAQSIIVSSSTSTQLPSDPPAQILTPVPLLEPLKPSVVQSQNMSSISWPDPGITDDEIIRFEALGYARIQNKHPPKDEKTVNIPNKNIIGQKELLEPSSVQKYDRKGSIESSNPPKSISQAKTVKATQKSKQSSLDDEEWSDFVSVQNSSPMHKLKTEKERSSTPDLPLSVLNLGNVQPAKQPIPVITPNGLVQTKLSSNKSLNFPNMTQQTNRMYPQQVQNNPIYQPSIISHQYASQAYGGFSNYGGYQMQTTSNSGSKVNGDDDEWSDFVSHQPTVQKASQSNWTSPPNQLSSWINSAPNIITNPAASLNVFSGSSVQKQTKKVPGPVQNRRGSGVPSVSVPDLDFLAPRNRTTQRK